MSKLSIIIPVFNEEKTIKKLLEKVLKVNIKPWKKEIILVNDGSTDSSFSKVNSHKEKIKILVHKNNLGKGEAIKTALKEAKGEAILIQDADLEYDPAEILNLLKYYQANNSLAVFGSRNLSSNKRSTWYYYFGVLFFGLLIKTLYGAWIADPYTCYKLIDAKLLKSLNLKSKGFEIEAEVTIKLIKRGIKIDEIPIKNYNPRKYSEGKKIKIKDGLIGLVEILRYKNEKVSGLF